MATPAMWAVQRCHYYVVHRLLQAGASMTLRDVQGSNMLHLATFAGHVLQLLILLHHDAACVDDPDPNGDTCLMWAAYKGYPACVDLLLRWGASVTVTDHKGFTALHWALVKGNALCIQKLVQAGADRFAETLDHKTPAQVAREMKTEGPWHRVLAELALDRDAHPRPMPVPFIRLRTFHLRFFFLAPFVSLIAFALLLSRFSIFVAVPICIAVAVVLQVGAQQVLQWAPTDMKHLQRTVSQLSHLDDVDGSRIWRASLPPRYSGSAFAG